MDGLKAAIGRWLKVQPDEIALFLWSAGLLYLIRTSNIFLNNFAETTFLKRFGVEYLPMVYVANSLTTFLIMGVMTAVLRKLPSGRVLSYLLIICGVSVAMLRPVVALDWDMVYPVLFMLKAQYEALLALVFWNLANDLFNTRQSKRIFPLITAGGVIGAIIGSFGTPALARAITLDNLMLAYLVTTIMAAAVVWRMSSTFQVMRLPERTAKKVQKRTNLIEEFKKVVPMMKESTLLKVLVLITFLPNVVLPLMNYQFNYAVNETFATEGGMVTFFGYFRGVLNIVSLVILLFVGKLYSRWGLPVALMFHPANYILAFLAFLFRFDVYAAMYARLSTRVLLVTINNPARNILMGLFPDEFRAILRPFLRGTVVRLGVLLGAGIIFVSEGWFSPRYLSIAGVVFTAGWVISTIWLKRSYSDILLDLIARNVIDLKSLEQKGLGQIFQNKRAQKQLVEACKQSRGNTCVWYAQMMKAQEVPNLDQTLLQLIRERSEDTAIDLLPLIPVDVGPEAMEVYEELADPLRPELSAALAQAAARLPHQQSGNFLERMLATDSLAVRAQAVIGLYRHDPAHYHAVIEDWLEGKTIREKRAGVVAAGGSGNLEFCTQLRKMLARETDPELKSQIMVALNRLDDPQMHQLVQEHLVSDPDLVPAEVFEAFNLGDDEALAAFIGLLGSEDSDRRNLALVKLSSSEDLNTHVLIESLAIPNKRIKEGLYSLMETMKISDPEIIAFARGYLEHAYRNLAEAEAVKHFPETPERGLLVDHLREKKDARLETILRVLATQDSSAQTRIITRGLHSKDIKLRSNALEALETMLGHNLSEAMVPLLEELGIVETLATGRKLFDLPADLGGRQALLGELLQKTSWVTQYLALTQLARGEEADAHRRELERLQNSDNPFVKELAGQLAAAA
jgi:TLC ATP/ADP transporter